MEYKRPAVDVAQEARPVSLREAKPFHVARLALCLSVFLLSLVAPRATEAQTVALTPGIINTVTGNGAATTYSGTPGSPTAAELSAPWSLAFDSNGNIYIADYENNVVRVVNVQKTPTTIAGVANIPGGDIATVAGMGPTMAGYNGDGIAATSAELNGPTGVALDSSNNIYIADQSNNRVRMVNASTGYITTVAGNGTYCSAPTASPACGDTGSATSAELAFPTSVALDSANNLYIADQGSNRVREVSGGTINTVAGNGAACSTPTATCGDGGTATTAQLNSPAGVAVDNANPPNIYIADQADNRVRKVTAATGNITTVAGNGNENYFGDGGPATSADLAYPTGVALDAAGDIYIADFENSRVRKVDIFGIITTVAGNGTACSNPTATPACGDIGGGNTGVATGAQLSDPAGAALDSAGDIYIADAGDNRVREVNVSMSALPFGTLNVFQTSSAQNVAVSNVGNAPLTSFSFGGSSNFLQSNDCAVPLAVGASCMLGVTFAPTVAGNPLAAILTIGDNATPSSQTVTLSGIANAVTPAFSGLTSLTVPSGTPSIYLSGTIGVGGHYPQSGETVTVTINNQSQPATIGASGGFSLSYTANGTLGTFSAGPYTITYYYQGDSSFGSVTDTSTMLTVSASGAPEQFYALTLTETGTGVGNVKDNIPGHINCSDSTGTVTGVCSTSYESGTQVTLTANPSQTAPNGGPTTFVWGGACASQNPSTTCNLTIGSELNVGAAFTPPPVTQNLPQFCTGTNQSASVTYCPANTYNAAGVCTDPNGAVFSVLIPVVNTCFQLQVTATEVKGTGICPGSQVANGGQSSDFDCRFVSYYNFGTTDSAGDVETPLCYPYSNGNCVFYDLQLVGNGGPVPAADYAGGVFWQIDINPSNAPLPPADQFTPPAGYAQTPRMLLDPSEDEVVPTVPWGTDCTVPMNTEGEEGFGSSVATNPPIYCQFDDDITTYFFGTVGGSDPQAGGKSGGTSKGGGSSDIVLAFLPTSTTGTGSPSPNVLPPPSAPTISLACINGCTPLGSVSSGGTLTFTEGTGGTAEVTETGYPTPTVTIAMANNTTGVTATESGNTVTLTAAGNFGQQFVPGVFIVVEGCTIPGYDGTFSISGVSGTMLTYTDSATGLNPESDGACMVTALPAGLTFNLTTGVLSGTPALGSAGSYPNTTFTATNSAGTTGPQNYTLVVSAASSTTTITSNTPNPSVVNQAVTIAFTVTGDDGTPTGSVTVNASTGESCSGALSSGAGNCNITFTTAGPRTLTATYSGDSNFNGSTSSPATAQTVNPTSSTTTITSNTPNPSTVNQAVAIAFTVTGNGGGTPTGSGKVNASTGESCSGALSSGAGSCNITFTTAGPRTLTATYSGDSNFNGSTSSPATAQTVTGMWTIAAAAPCSPAGAFTPTGPVSVGQSVTCVFTATNNTATASTVTATIPGGGSGGSDNEGANDADDYSIGKNTCNKTIAAGGTCQVTVTWKPDNDDLPLYSTGSYAYLEILNGSGKSATTLVSAKMTGVTEDPTVSVSASGTALTSPYSYTFPSSTANEPETFTLTNNGPTPLFLTNAITISNTNYFTLNAGTCTNGTKVPYPGNCTFSVTFKPPSSGTTVEKATVTIKDNAVTTANPTTISPQTISLSGAR
jgi:hypothetical protein